LNWSSGSQPDEVVPQTRITHSGTPGNITIIANQIAMNGRVWNYNGTVTLKPMTAGRAIDLGGADSVSTLGISLAELNQIDCLFLRIGDVTSGNITVTAAINPSKQTALSLVSGGTITQNGGRS
jgi:hypothetical protein